MEGESVPYWGCASTYVTYVMRKRKRCMEKGKEGCTLKKSASPSCNLFKKKPITKGKEISKLLHRVVVKKYSKKYQGIQVHKLNECTKVRLVRVCKKIYDVLI